MRILLKSLLIIGTALAGTATIAQQPYPSRPVTITVPFSPGSGVDVPARIAADLLSKAMSQTFVVENRTGAAGMIATTHVAGLPADGYNLLANSAAHTLYPSLYKSLRFDPAKDFVPVAPIAEVPLVLVAAPSRGWRSVREMLAYAKANPGKLNYGSAGKGTTSHMSFERLRAAAQISGAHIPFKGTPEAITDVMAGRVDVVYTTVSAAAAGIAANRLVPLAVGGRTRAPGLPDVPTTLEAGYPESDYTVWVGLLAPAGTPAAVVERINNELRKAMATPEAQDRITKSGLAPMSMTVAQFQAAVRQEFSTNAAITKAAGIEPE